MTGATEVKYIQYLMKSLRNDNLVSKEPKQISAKILTNAKKGSCDCYEYKLHLPMNGTYYTLSETIQKI